MSEIKNQYNFVTWLRVAAMTSILLCHFVSQSEVTLLNMTGQFFNVGVQIFILLSGFLYGVRGGGTHDPLKWYRRRLLRIFVPYELFVILLLAITLIKGLTLSGDWIWLALGLQGSVVGVLGAEQTWFITPLLMCYAITPALDRFLPKDMPRRRAAFTIAVAILVKLLWIIPESAAYDTLLSLVSWYVIGFVIGRCFDRIELNKSSVGTAFFVMVIAFAIRIVGRFLCDGTVLYDRVICGYTHFVAAVCIFYIFAVVFRVVRPNRLIQNLSTISFEVYLVHYMFCVGPVSLFDFTDFWAVNCMVVTLVAFLVALAINTISMVVIDKMRSN